MGVEMTTNPFLLIGKSTPLFLKGAAVTIELFLLAALLSVALGVCLGILSSEQFKVPYASKIINGLTFVSRAVPFFVQLLIVYFVVPDLFGFSLNPFAASIIALGLCSSGYVAQFIRGAINSLPLSQWESAFTLGYTKKQSLFFIILPQSFRLALPSLNNEFESLLKSTAIASSIGMLELTRIGMNVVSREMEPVPIYLAIAFLYGCLSLLLNFFTKRLEKRFTYAKY